MGNPESLITLGTQYTHLLKQLEVLDDKVTINHNIEQVIGF
jgi:hypothetical protein